MATSNRLLATLGLVALAGCSGEEAMRVEVANLKSTIEQMQIELAKTASDAARATRGSSATIHAQDTADQAAALARASGAAIAALDQKIDRMFKRPAENKANPVPENRQ